MVRLQTVISGHLFGHVCLACRLLKTVQRSQHYVEKPLLSGPKVGMHATEQLQSTQLLRESEMTLSGLLPGFAHAASVL